MWSQKDKSEREGSGFSSYVYALFSATLYLPILDHPATADDRFLPYNRRPTTDLVKDFLAHLRPRAIKIISRRAKQFRPLDHLKFHIVARTDVHTEVINEELR